VLRLFPGELLEKSPEPWNGPGAHVDEKKVRHPWHGWSDPYFKSKTHEFKRSGCKQQTCTQRYLSKAKMKEARS
jgi:hypothetical protein